MKKRIFKSFLAAVLIIFPMAALYGAEGNRVFREQLTTESVNNFLDDFIAYAEENYHVPQMSMAVVFEGGSAIRGYGMADRESKTPVNPENTRFAIGSSSKTLVYISVMQLVQKGLIDLNDPVLDYIDLDLKLKRDRLITIGQLMNHKAGFEENLTGVLARSYDTVLPLDQYLMEYEPEQVYDPGTITSYSNYGNTLLAYLVQEVSGVSFNEYIKANIIEPLGMKNTDYDYEGMSSIAKRYEFNPVNGNYEPMGEFYFNVWPAGAIRSTAEDMALLMTAFLKGGPGERPVILSGRSLEELFSSGEPVAEGFASISDGFITGSYHGHEFIGHGGTTPFQFTGMNLLKDYGIGLYITSGSSDGRPVNSEYLSRFIDRFLIDRSVILERAEGVELRRFAGSYYSSRTAFSDFQKILQWFQTEELSVAGDEIVNAEGLKFYPVSADTLCSADGRVQYFFRFDEKGKAERFYSSVNPTAEFLKSKGIESLSIQFLIIGAAFSIIIGLLILRGITAAVRKIRKRQLDSTVLSMRKLSNPILWYMGGTGIVYTSMILFFDQNALMKEEILLVRIAMMVGTIIIPLVLFHAWRLIGFVRNHNVKLMHKLGESLLLLSLVSVCLWLNYWKLFIWNIL